MQILIDAVLIIAAYLFAWNLRFRTYWFPSTVRVLPLRYYVIALLLIVLLGIILVLNFMPDSAIAFKIDSIIENITSHFTAVDVMGREILL